MTATVALTRGRRADTLRQVHMLYRTISCLLSLAAMAASLRADQPNTPVGTWRGESRCLVRPSACRDEDSVYRIAPVAQSQGKLTLDANKVVDGREVNMGTSECSFVTDTQVLTCPLPNGSTIRFDLKADSLNGTMVLADGTEWRKIALRRIHSKR